MCTIITPTETNNNKVYEYILYEGILCRQAHYEI